MPEKRPDWMKKRMGRIAKLCVPEVVAAIAEGYISPSSVDKFWRGLSAGEQRERIASLRAAEDRERMRARAVVAVLRAQLESGTRDLHDLRRELLLSLGELKLRRPGIPAGGY